MKTITRIIAAALLVSGISAACTDLDDLQQKVDSLESRVTALETLIPNINANVEALQVLVNGTTINSATQKDGVWTLVLSNGETITLTAGSLGVGNAPVMSVDKDGYWMVDYGNGAEYVLMNGEKVKAVGTDGITPKFGVDKDGYWTVSYDGGKTFTQVKGADGNPVSALPSGEVQDPYFADVKLENGVFTVTLRTGEVLTVPVVVDFLCAIESTGILTYNYGETKPYNVTMKGVASTMVTAPHGWKAALNENVLTVTAPAAPTKATLADSGSDVCILAFSTSGYATIAKVQVRLSDSPVAVVNPIASVTAGEATETTLTYNVALVDATSYKYIHQKESETAPDAAKIAADGVESTETALTFSELESATAYVLYVLPINGEKQGAVASAKNTTLKQLIASYYALYNAGETITIDGRQISKELYGDATLMEADGNITTNGVYFLKEGVTATYTGTGAIKKFIIIGDKEGARSTFKAPVSQTGESKYMKLNGNGDGTGYVIFHNVIFDQSAESTQYAITVNFDESFPLIIFSSCQIKQNSAKPIFYISSAKRSITDLRFVDCDCNVTAAQPILSCGSSTATYGTYTVKNCVFYGDGTKGFNFHGGNKVTFNEIIFTNNTFVNIIAGNNTWFNCGTITKATATSNLILAKTALSANQSILNSANAVITGGTISQNICYTGQENTFMAIYGGKDKWFEGVEEITKLESDPFTGGTFDLANGRFTPAAAYATYGAKR